MPSALLSSLTDSLTESAEKELRRLVRAVASAKGLFALFPVESDLNDQARAAALERLSTGLTERQGQRLRVLSISGQQWDVLTAIQSVAPYSPGDVALLLGFEETPGIADERLRPKALARLNVQREQIEDTLKVPLILWCRPWLYDQLQKHAPDFFDHFVATFTLHGADHEVTLAIITRTENDLSGNVGLV